MNKITISIIVFISNTEKYLSSCLDNLVNQAFKNIEILCVIDASSDSSLEICRNYAQNDSRVVVISQENHDLSGAGNSLINYAKGEYIQFCNPADCHTHDMSGKLYDAIFASGADFAVAGTQAADYIPGDESYHRAKGEGLFSVNEIVFKSTDIAISNKVFKKSILCKYNIDLPVGQCDDNARSLYKYLFVSETAYYYTRHNDSIIKKHSKKIDKPADYTKSAHDIKAFLLINNMMHSYKLDIFLWIVINFAHLTVLYGDKPCLAPAVKNFSALLSDIDEQVIASCPCVTKAEVSELLAVKNNDAKLFLKIFRDESRKSYWKKRLNAAASPFFPKGSRRRKVAVAVVRILKKLRQE